MSVVCLKSFNSLISPFSGNKELVQSLIFDAMVTEGFDEHGGPGQRKNT